MTDPKAPTISTDDGRDRYLADIPKIKRGLVWCTECGRIESVKGYDCFRTGWPECCGYTMTLDSPEERATR